MEYLDITHGISSGMLVYPGDPKVLLRQFRQGPLVTKLTMGLHAGTHVDAPAHYIKGGKTISEVGLGRLNGAARVCDFTDVWLEIDKAQIMSIKPRKGDIILLKTRNSRMLKDTAFNKQHTRLGQDAADYLIEKKINAVGIDYLSIGGNAVHKSLLIAGIPVIECLDLSLARSGRYKLMCMPLKILGAEAAPARCVLLS